MLLLRSIIPPDIELVIPGNVGFFEFLLVLSFLIHIIFVNITIGSSSMAVYQEIKGIRTRKLEDDKLAFQLATHTSILKSIAVVLGVAPLLLVSVIYTQYFYPSTILIGKAWLSLLIILAVAFLLLYAYKFTWDKMKDHPTKKRIHVLFGLSGSLLLLFVPLIFIVNVVSMLYPEMWEGANGFFHSLAYYPQIWPRYFHFILASFAIAGFYAYYWNNRLQKKAGDDDVDDVKQLVTEKGKRLGLQVLIVTTALQFLFGFLLLFSFESNIRLLYLGDDLLLTTLLIVSLLTTGLLLYFLYLLMAKDKRKYLFMSAVSFVIILAAMGWMRHELRETYLNPYLDENQRTTSIEMIETIASDDIAE